MASLARFLGRAVSEGAGFAWGRAAAPVLAPPLQELRNTINSRFAFVYPEAGTLAAGVAQGQVDRKTAETWAAFHGVGHQAFEALVQIENTGPGMAASFDLWRRGKITEPRFRAALTRAAIEPEWIEALVQTKHVLLDPAAVANAVQQGHLPNAGILPDPVFGDGTLDIPLTQIDLDPMALFEGHGIDFKTGQVMANLSGLPPPQGELRDMLNRQIITDEAFEAGIREGHTKTKWVGAVKRMARKLLTETTYIDAHLRGWIPADQMYAGTKLHGLTPEDTDLLFKVHGRPLSWHEVVIGLARGGEYDGPVDMISPPFLRALQQSSLRPEWYNLAWHSRYHLLTPFMLRALTQAGDLTAEQTTAQLVQQGYEPGFAALVSGRWAATKGGASKEASATDLLTLYDGRRLGRPALLDQLGQLGYDQADAERKADIVDARRVVSAKNTAITGLHKHYEKGGVTRDNLLSALAALGVATWAAGDIVEAWDIELAGRG